MTEVQIKIDLDMVWVDAILVTAFDSMYGGCNYWINEGDIDELGDVTDIIIHDDTNAKDGKTYWWGVTLEGEDNRRVHVGKGNLDFAVNKILREFPAQSDTKQQLLMAISTPDAAPDLDATAADVIVQMALFDEVLYG